MTTAKLKKEIETLRNALAQQSTKATVRKKLNKELEERTEALKKIIDGEKAKVKAKKLTSIDKIKVLIENNKKYEGYKGANWNLEVDGKRPAKPVGARVRGKGVYRKPTKADYDAGLVYSEKRLNHADVSGGKKSYPKLRMGGEMHKG